MKPPTTNPTAGPRVEHINIMPGKEKHTQGIFKAAYHQQDIVCGNFYSVRVTMKGSCQIHNIKQLFLWYDDTQQIDDL